MMDKSELIMFLLSTSASGIAGIFGWLVGKRKKDAETRLLETDVLISIKEFYQEIINDNKNNLLSYKSQIESLQQRVREQDLKITDLSKIVNEMAIFTCYRQSCPYRMLLKEPQTNENNNEVFKDLKQMLKEDELNN